MTARGKQMCFFCHCTRHHDSPTISMGKGVYHRTVTLCHNVKSLGSVVIGEEGFQFTDVLMHSLFFLFTVNIDSFEL